MWQHFWFRCFVSYLHVLWRSYFLPAFLITRWFPKYITQHQALAKYNFLFYFWDYCVSNFLIKYVSVSCSKLFHVLDVYCSTVAQYRTLHRGASHNLPLLIQVNTLKRPYMGHEWYLRIRGFIRQTSLRQPDSKTAEIRYWDRVFASPEYCTSLQVIQ
jgi:hypothetical protein